MPNSARYDAGIRSTSMMGRPRCGQNPAQMTRPESHDQLLRNVGAYVLHSWQWRDRTRLLTVFYGPSSPVVARAYPSVIRTIGHHEGVHGIR